MNAIIAFLEHYKDIIVDYEVISQNNRNLVLYFVPNTNNFVDTMPYFDNGGLLWTSPVQLIKEELEELRRYI